jgi:hypothetical protein
LIDLIFTPQNFHIWIAVTILGIFMLVFLSVGEPTPQIEMGSTWIDVEGIQVTITSYIDGIVKIKYEADNVSMELTVKEFKKMFKPTKDILSWDQ